VTTSTENLSVPDTRRPDRQKYQRVHFNDQVTVYPVIPSSYGVLEIPEKSTLAQCHDISESGIRLKLKRGQHPTEILKVRLKLQSAKPLDVYAKLIWKKGPVCGFQYIVLNDADREQIRAYVNNIRAETIRQDGQLDRVQSTHKKIEYIRVETPSPAQPKKIYPFYWGNLTG
jgi:hypothetical protein